MKKTIITSLCAAAFAVLAVSCQKVEPVADSRETIEISINGLMGEYAQVDAAKSSLVNNVRVSWAAGDVVYVFDGTKCLGSLVASLDGDEDRYARLSTDGSGHTIIKPADGTTKLTLVHSPLLTEAPDVNDGAVSISLADQSGEKAPFVAYATLDYTNEETITDALVPFKFATSVIKVNCTGLRANTAIDIAALSNVNTACRFTLSGTAAPIVEGDANGVIIRTNDAYFAAEKVNSEGVAVFQIAAPVFSATSEARVLTIAQGLNYCKYKNFSKKPLPAATSVNTVCQTIALPEGALPGEFTLGGGVGVRFSRGNLYYDGADWGFETEQYYFRTYDGNGKCDAGGYDEESGTTGGHWGLFGWSTAKTTYGMSVSKSDADYSGDFVDWGKAIDDKGTWTTLSGGTDGGEWKSLFDNHVNGWGTCNDVPGRFIAPDGFEGGISALSEAVKNWERAQIVGIVFLPAAGTRTASEVTNVGAMGCYWSSSACNETDGYGILFNGSYTMAGSFLRSYGTPVRLITACE